MVQGMARCPLLLQIDSADMKWPALVAIASLIAVGAVVFNTVIDKHRVYRATNDFGGVACFSRSSHRTWARHKVYQRTVSMMEMLASNECVLIDDGAKVQIYDRDGKVSRVYISRSSGGRILAWTFNKNFE